MTLNFSKYQGTGNDFILIDNRSNFFPKSNQGIIARLCHRKFGIGADGLMLLQNKNGYDFEMVYYNADGRESSMCGNGGRCIAAFASSLGIINDKGVFLAIDGAHDFEIKDKTPSEMVVSLKMIDVMEVNDNDDHFTLNTGSPHYIVFTKGIEQMDVVENGKKIRYNDRYSKEGINVNFVETNENYIKVRTYERGVEDETLSCGTGVTAAALATVYAGKLTNKKNVAVKVPGGDLIVYFSNMGMGKFVNVWLEGPATFVFNGIIEI